MAAIDGPLKMLPAGDDSYVVPLPVIQALPLETTCGLGSGRCGAAFPILSRVLVENLADQLAKFNCQDLTMNLLNG
jgi:hypothetical protein